tara:strand:- start:1168 stop:1371 length:204 start_codon:yes stop_codon:yes gene_type:complete
MAKHFPDHLLRPKILTADASKFETQAKAAFETSLMSIDAEMRACASMLRKVSAGAQSAPEPVARVGA